jgi:hypothetical protein
MLSLQNLARIKLRTSHRLQALVPSLNNKHKGDGLFKTHPSRRNLLLVLHHLAVPAPSGSLSNPNSRQLLFSAGQALSVKSLPLDKMQAHLSARLLLELPNNNNSNSLHLGFNSSPNSRVSSEANQRLLLFLDSLSNSSSLFLAKLNQHKLQLSALDFLDNSSNSPLRVYSELSNNNLPSNLVRVARILESGLAQAGVYLEVLLKLPLQASSAEVPQIQAPLAGPLSLAEVL